MEALGIASSVLGIIQTVYRLAQVTGDLAARPIFVRYSMIAIEEGILVMIAYAIIPGSHGAFERVDVAMSNPDPNEGLSSLRESLGSNLNMVAVTGAIVAQIAITGLSLESMAEAHWTASAFLVASLIFGVISVYVAFVLQQQLSGILRPVGYDEWFSRPRRIIDSTSWRGRILAYFDGFRLIAMPPAYVGTGRVPSAGAAIMLAAPAALLGFSLNAFLIGFGIYLGCVYTDNLVSGYGKSGSLGILIFYIAAATIGTLSYTTSWVAREPTATTNLAAPPVPAVRTEAVQNNPHQNAGP